MVSKRTALLGIALAAHAFPALAQDCIVTSRALVDLGASARGVVMHLHADRSDHVIQGQVLAEFEASEERARLALAELAVRDDTALRLATVRAERARIKVERIRKLDQQGLTVKDDLEEAELAHEVAQIEVQKARFDKEVAREERAAAEAALERKRVRAPFDAVVVERLMSPGEVYNEDTAILRLAQLDTLYVESYLPMSERAKLSTGDVMEIVLEDGRTRQAKLSVIDPILDAATGTFGLRLILPNPDGDILAGSRCVLGPFG
ncbi:MAG: efflux RND transporter periplasmic adaptor subunit [Paracoccaceae bacterium]